MAASGSVPTRDGLFRNGKFWLDRRIPQWSMIKEMIRDQGGTIVMMEKDADVRLVDHLRHDLKEVTVNTVSYKYVERSVQNNKLEDFSQHRVGSTAPRPMGASYIARKGTRNEYTRADDQLLFDWLYPYEQSQGAPINGNKIYQDIAHQYPHHTWQSWRGRYLKTVRGKPRPGGGVPRTDVAVSRRRQLELAPPLQTTLAHGRPPASGPSLPSSRVPAAAQQIQNLEGLKRKRLSASEQSNPTSPTMPHPKRGLMNTADAMNVMANDISHSARRRRHHHPRSPSLELSSPGTPSRSTKSLHDISSKRAPRVSQSEVREQRESARQQTSTPISNPRHSPSEHQPDMQPLFFTDLPYCSSIAEDEADDEYDDSDGDGEDDEDEYDSIEDWVKAQMARWKFDEPTIKEVLIRTSNNPLYAKRALAKWVPGQIIPDMRGVWTIEDDRFLEAPDSRQVERVTQKHGKDLCNDRLNFLHRARQAGVSI